MTNLNRLAIAALSTSLALALAACGDDGDDGDSGTTDTGMTDTGMTDTGSEDTGSDDTGANDTGADVATGTFTIGGSIFNNTGTTEGVLRVALVPVDVEGGEPIAELEDDAAIYPYSWQFTDVSLGSYFVVAMLDVDEPNDVTDPGPGDLAGRTEDSAGGDQDGAVVENINVEIR